MEKKLSLKEFSKKRVLITREALQALHYCIPFSTSNIFNYDKLLSYMLIKTKKNTLSYLSAALTNECLYIINFNLKALLLIIIRSILDHKTVISIHDVCPHPGKLCFLTKFSNLIAIKLSYRIVVYSENSSNQIKKSYHISKSHVILLPLECYWYDY